MPSLFRWLLQAGVLSSRWLPSRGRPVPRRTRRLPLAAMAILGGCLLIGQGPGPAGAASDPPHRAYPYKVQNYEVTITGTGRLDWTSDKHDRKYSGKATVYFKGRWYLPIFIDPTNERVYTERDEAFAHPGRDLPNGRNWFVGDSEGEWDSLQRDGAICRWDFTAESVMDRVRLVGNGLDDGILRKGGPRFQDYGKTGILGLNLTVVPVHPGSFPVSQCSSGNPQQDFSAAWDLSGRPAVFLHAHSCLRHREVSVPLRERRARVKLRIPVSRLLTTGVGESFRVSLRAGRRDRCTPFPETPNRLDILTASYLVKMERVARIP